jgi:molybdopterin adenylyltransferase
VRIIIKVGIVTVSDRCYAGTTKDLSGPAIIEKLPLIDGEVVCYKIVPDNRQQIAEILTDIADNYNADLILTTGGTGFSVKDITPEATLDVISRQAPGIPEAMRQYSLQFTKHAMLSRAVAGMRNQTLIINLPGSPKAASECMDIIVDAIPHAIKILKGELADCRDDTNKLHGK